MLSDAGCPTMASRSMLGSGERAVTSTEKSVDTASWAMNWRTDRDDSPEANVSSRLGMADRSLRFAPEAWLARSVQIEVPLDDPIAAHRPDVELLEHAITGQA